MRSRPITVKIEGLPDNAILHVDDSATGAFAGMDPACDRCGNRVGYVNSDTPATTQEAEAAAFIPCVEFDEGPLLCLACARITP